MSTKITKFSDSARKAWMDGAAGARRITG